MEKGLVGSDKQAYNLCDRKLHFGVISGAHTSSAAEMANEILTKADKPGCIDDTIMKQAAVNISPMNVMYM